MRIGQLAKQAGISVETVRFYERRGLIVQPARPSGGGYRDYPEEAVQRIRFIRGAQRLGFSLDEIAALLELKTGPDARCSDIREKARIKRQQVQAKIDDLERIKAALDTLIRICPGTGPVRKCSILQAINEQNLPLVAMTQEQDHDQRQAEN
ncbi:MAG: MerR family transcriptional regulator [Alphaproteobacteria bacterium]|nr:MAG: MerR family transcriptional regulator [Alphaproteobacteria bacterium]